VVFSSGFFFRVRRVGILFNHSKVINMDSKKTRGFSSIKYWRILFPILLLACIICAIIIIVIYPATEDMFAAKVMPAPNPY
jgi:hypothetical protein